MISNHDDDDDLMIIKMTAGEDLLCYSCNLLNRGNPTPCPGPLLAFPGAQVRELQIINIFKVMIKMEQPGTINIHKPSQACRVLSLENGTVVKQGVSPRGLCQGILLIIDH